MPTDPPAITGTFMESRETRFHTGLDIRTEGTTGWPVLSPVDGWVSRLRCSPRGYGLALYVATGEGRTVVFAHLDRFFDPAADRLRRAQAASGRYEQDLSFAPGEIPVARGEVVALSGETGTGAPHLHLEVRDAAQRPVNPADFLEVPDQVAPEVLGVRLVGVDPAAPWTLEVDEPGASVAARGRWRVEVMAVDHTGFAPFPVAPRELTLYVDGVRHYRLGHDGLSFDESRQMRLDQERDGRGRWYRLTRREGLTLPGREGPGTPVEVSDRPVELFVVVEDSRGLRGEFALVLRPDPAARPVEALRFDAGPELLVAEVPGAGDLPPLLDGPAGHELLERVDGGWRLALPCAGLADGSYELMRRGESLLQRELRFPADGLAGFAADDAPALLPAPDGVAWPGGVLELALVDPDPAPGLEPVGRGLKLVSHGFVPATALRFDAGAYDPGDHTLLMRFDGRRWESLDGDGPVGSTDAFGVVALLRDTTPPAVGELEGGDPGPGGLRVVRPRGPASAHGITLPAWPPLEVPVVDEGAGLPDAGPEVLLDGNPWPARWDGERERVLVDGFVEPPPGRHVLTVRARDRAGRTAERSWDVEFLR